MPAQLQPLLDLYTALQECPPSEQADRQDAFKTAVKEVAAAHGKNHWEVTAFVIKKWYQANSSDDKRKGKNPEKKSDKPEAPAV